MFIASISKPSLIHVRHGMKRTNNDPNQEAISIFSEVSKVRILRPMRVGSSSLSATVTAQDSTKHAISGRIRDGTQQDSLIFVTMKKTHQQFG